MSKEISELLAILADEVENYDCLSKVCPLRSKKRIRELCQRPFCYLYEDPVAMLNKVKVEDLTTDALILKPDHFFVRFYKGDMHNKACDYLILTEVAGRKHAFFLDLKTDIWDRPHADGRLCTNSERDAECAMQFCGAEALHKALSYSLECLTGCSALSSYKTHFCVLYKKFLSSPSVTSFAQPTTQNIPGVVKRFARSKLRDRVHALQIPNNGTVSITALTAT